MTGFKNFILRGNLIELAVAFIMATALAAVVTATVNVIMGLVGKAGGHSDFSTYQPGGLLIGAWLTAVITFLVLSAIVYFGIVKPYTLARERWSPSTEPGTPEDVELLQEIRDLLAGRGDSPTSRGAATPPPVA
jgi:large conductance mechanosensitive channel